ncbi:FmdB family zinc ribbon protein [Teredinibacter waterburyi]|uniref:FmdB family zinc ribbon protein n=1 Tax=Teredinibacter waterburyi TaxID=1500538 RepID=UPI00165EDC95|nr:zinc ribbon domain-containing protein [Teredinibacter waterburyi]
MPVYDYKCAEHGVFNDLATMDDSDKPCACPRCGELSARIIRLSPELVRMAPEKKHAHEVNERNQHEPTHSTKDRRADDEQHSKGCGCERKIGKSNLLYTAKGEKMFPSMRPWMISH